MKFSITDWQGKVHHLHPTTLYTRIMKDSSNSNYNWFASAPELVRTCSATGFPLAYARKIKIAILRCFAAIELTYKSISEDEHKAVYFCYNSLSNTHKESVEAKNLYLKNIIKEVTIYHYGLLAKLTIPAGPTFKKICDVWIKKQFSIYSSKERIDFEHLIQVLHNDFEKTIQDSKADGAFDNDIQMQKREMAKLAKLIANCGNI